MSNTVKLVFVLLAGFLLVFIFKNQTPPSAKVSVDKNFLAPVISDSEKKSLENYLQKLEKKRDPFVSVYRELTGQSSKILNLASADSSWENFYLEVAKEKISENALINAIFFRLYKSHEATDLAESLLLQAKNLLYEERNLLDKYFSELYPSADSLLQLNEEDRKSVAIKLANKRTEIRKIYDPRYQELFTGAPQLLNDFNKHLRNSNTIGFTNTGFVWGGVGE